MSATPIFGWTLHPTIDPDRVPDCEMRVSDAERSAVAERLSQHFSDGRLDHTEFEERVDRALKAKTRADLAGLFAGLSGSAIDAGPVPAPNRVPVHPGRRPPLHRAVVLLVVIVVTAGVGQSLLQPHLPWLLLGLLVFLWLRHRHHHPDRR